MYTSNLNWSSSSSPLVIVTMIIVEDGESKEVRAMKSLEVEPCIDIHVTKNDCKEDLFNTHTLESSLLDLYDSILEAIYMNLGCNFKVELNYTFELELEMFTHDVNNNDLNVFQLTNI